METRKLATNKIYRIISIKSIETKFGKCYILTDEKYEDYFSTNKINKYIETNGIENNENKKFLFTIRTGVYKTFKKDNDEEIKYLDCKIY